MKLKHALELAVVFLISGIALGALIVYSVSPSTTFTISGGVYPGAPSYTVWKEGSNYFAKDANGWMGYSDTNLSSILGSVFGSSDDVFFRKADYYLDSPVTIISGLTLRMEVGANFYITANTDMFRCASWLNGFRIYGGYYYFSYNGSLVNASAGGAHMRFKDMVVETDNSYSGTLLKLAQGINSLYENYIEDSSINTASNGVYLLDYTGSELFVNGVKFGCSLGYATVLISGGFSSVTNSGFERVRVLLQSSNGNLFDGNYFSNSPDYAIEVYTGGNTTISNNEILELTLGTDSFAYGILLYSASYNLIVGNNIRTSLTDSRGICEQGSSNWNTIVSCNAFGGTAPIKTLGANTKTHSCYNGTTWVT